MITVLSQTPLATVQDLGRAGALRWGVGTAGAMDPMAFAAGNLLVGNERNAAAIELQVFPFEALLERDASIAVTGANCSVTLDGQAVLPWFAVVARAGQSIRIGLPRAGVMAGARAYLCIAGGIDVAPALGSRSTQLRGAIGGFEGRALRAGDRLPLGEGAPAVESLGLVPWMMDRPLMADGLPAVRAIRAAEHDAFTEESQALFWSAAWRVTAQSDRYGFRLAGPALVPKAPMELRSHGIVPGVVQVPHGGQPIVQMRDAQPSGGYPKIAAIIEADIGRLGQAPIGSEFRFVETDWAGAIAALDENEGWLAKAESLLTLQRSRRAA